MKTLIVLICLFPLNLFCQDSIISELKIVDTNTYNGKRIIVFNDGSWEYEGEFKVVETFSSSIIDGVVVIDAANLFTKNWRNYKTFSNFYNGSKMLDSISINVDGAVLPTNKPMNSGFKIRWGRWHNGNDYAASVGTAVLSTWGGRVRYAQMNAGGYGNLIIIRHYNGLESYYAHLSEINVRINQDVSAGQLIGRVGSSGKSTGPHLHYEIRFLDNPFDPGLIFNQKTVLLHAPIFSHSYLGKEFSVKEVLGVASHIEVKKSVSQVQKVKKRRTANNL
jgi:hypothetical protein